MNSDIPKQFLDLEGQPVILRSIHAFLEFDPAIKLTVVLPESHFQTWKEICSKYSFSHPYLLAKGGETRFHSVKSGLAMIPDDDVVAIHDAVRPLVSLATIDKGFRDALAFGNAVPVVTVNESVRWKEGPGNHPVDREHLRIVQTPQVFDASLIKRAYQRIAGHDAGGFTDDASVLEAMGVPIHLYEGHRENIKITHPDDLAIAKALLTK
jgi:2-C-methyl-D-erythritol 4-phosphate cytidylyltransferase